MKKQISLLLLACSVLAAACKKDAQPAAVSIFPAQGIAGSHVTITGGGFSASFADTKVFFNGKPAYVVSVSKDSIVAEVPAAAGNGKLTVTSNGKTRVGPEFNYILSAIVDNLAGKAEPGANNGSGAGASFWSPHGVAADAQGNIYVADAANHLIRKISPAGVVSTFAGSTDGYNDGDAATAKFRYPSGVVVDANGNLFVADTYNHKIRKITAAGTVTTFAGSTEGFADGTGTAAKLRYPTGMAFDADGNLIIADNGNHRIRKITPAGVVTTIAGGAYGFADGTGVAAKFANPNGVAIDKSGIMYVADYYNHAIRKITPAGVVTTLAGGIQGYNDAAGTAAKFDFPSNLTIDAQQNIIVTDNNNHKLRKVTLQGAVTTFAGGADGYRNGPAAKALFSLPDGICTDKQGRIFVTDQHRLRLITMQ